MTREMDLRVQLSVVVHQMELGPRSHLRSMGHLQALSAAVRHGLPAALVRFSGARCAPCV